MEACEPLAGRSRAISILAANWLEKNILISLALPASDLEALKAKAGLAGISYEALIANLVHQFVTGKIEVKA